MLIKYFVAALVFVALSVLSVQLYGQARQSDMYDRAEWRTLRQTLDSLGGNAAPQAGLFVSKQAIARYLKTYEGLKAEFPERWPLLKGVTFATLNRIDLESRQGFMTATGDLSFAGFRFDLHLALVYDRIEERPVERNGKPDKEYRLLLKVRPIASAVPTTWLSRLWLSNRHHQSLASAALEAAEAIFDLAQDVQLDVPYKLDIPLNIDDTETVEFKKDDNTTVIGSLKLHKSLPAPTVQRGIAYSAPIFLEGGVALLARVRKPEEPAPQAQEPKQEPDLATMRQQLPQMRQRLEVVTRTIPPSNKDFELWIKKSLAAELIAQIATLPPAQRSLSVRSSEPNGYIFEASGDPQGLTYKARVLPKSATGLAVLDDLKATLEGQAEVTVTGRVAASATAVATAHWESWILLAPGSYEVTATGTASTPVSGKLEMFPSSSGKVRAAYWGINLTCTQVIVDARTDSGKVFSLVAFHHGEVRTKLPVMLFEGKGNASPLIDNRVHRTPAIREKADPSKPKLVPNWPGIDVAYSAEEAAVEGDAYHVAGSIHITGASNAEFTPDEKRANDDLIKLADKAEFPGEHRCPPKVKAETTIASISAEAVKAAVNLVVGPIKTEGEKLKIWERYSKDGNAPAAVKAWADTEINGIKQRMSEAERLGRHLLNPLPPPPPLLPVPDAIPAPLRPSIRLPWDRE